MLELGSLWAESLLEVGTALVPGGSGKASTHHGLAAGGHVGGEQEHLSVRGLAGDDLHVDADAVGPYGTRREEEEGERGLGRVGGRGGALHLPPVPPALSCRHWGDQEGESSWVRGEVGGQVQGPQVPGLARSQPWEGPGRENRAKGGEGGSTGWSKGAGSCGCGVQGGSVGAPEAGRRLITSPPRWHRAWSPTSD